MDGQWKDFVTEWLKEVGKSGGFDRVPLAGDASNRQYFRVHFSIPDFETAVLMQKNAVEGFKKSEEAVSSVGKGPPGDPFILIARFLWKEELPVPDLYHVKNDGSFILQEDLGDDTLNLRLSHHPEEADPLTESALSLLVKLQGIDWNQGLSWLSGRQFTSELIRWEFEHFLEYGLSGTSASAVEKIREFFDRESQSLAGEDRLTLVHRDYHSRNLMVRRDNRLGLIDFQDLLRGSPFYDLASFLFDPYRILPMDRIIHWFSLYYGMAMDAGVLPSDLGQDEAEERFLRHAFQRNLKACGRFFYISDVKGNPSFLTSVEGTHHNLGRLAGRIPDLRTIYDRFAPYLRIPPSGLRM